MNYHLNRQYFHGNDPGTGDKKDPVHSDLGKIYPQIEPDGFTVILTAQGIPYQNPEQTNTIKIVVADVVMGFWIRGCYCKVEHLVVWILRRRLVLVFNRVMVSKLLY